jgi:hypothetical protein
MRGFKILLFPSVDSYWYLNKTENFVLVRNVIIGKNINFWATAFLRRFCQTCLLRPSGFQFFGFRNNIFFYRARSLLLYATPNLEDQVPVLMSHSYRMAQLYSQALGSLYIAIYDSQGYGGGILTRLHMR